MVGFYNSQCTCIYVSQGSGDIKLEIKIRIDGPPSWTTVLHRLPPSCTVLPKIQYKVGTFQPVSVPLTYLPLVFVACSSRCEHDVCISGANRLCTTRRNAAPKTPLNPLALRCGTCPYRPVKGVGKKLGKTL